MGAVSKGNITFAKKTNKESLSCEFINMCYHIVLLTQIERYNWISEDSDNEKITLDIPPIKKAQFGYQADHQKKSQKATRKRQVLQNQCFVGLFLLSFGYLARHEKVTDRQKLVPYSYPRHNSSKRGTICRKMAKCCRDLATLHLSHYELIKVVL